jgi:ABC-type oligopeptide transport system ATPase subunit
MTPAKAAATRLKTAGSARRYMCGNTFAPPCGKSVFLVRRGYPEEIDLSSASQFIDKLPHQLSGGQRQRIVVARALAPKPEIIIADEPISMLDVSIRAEILQLLDELVKGQGISMLYITHDLLSARLLADDILVLHRGRVVENGDASKVITAPDHEYTRLLLDSIPNPFAAD